MTNTNNTNGLEFGWTRPPGPPKVWSVIESKTKDGTPVKFTIQDIPEDFYEEAINLMATEFIVDEVVSQCLEVAKDPIAVEDARRFWRIIFNQNISIGAFVEDPNSEKPILAGINALAVDAKGVKISISDFNLESDIFKTVLTTMIDLSHEANVYERYDVDEYLTALGLLVRPKFRGVGLSVPILQAREFICKEYGIRVTSTIFTSTISQKSAARAGFEVIYAKDYDQFYDDKGQQIFRGIKYKTIKAMAKQFC